MTTWAPGLALAIFLLIGARGVALMRERGPLARFADAADELQPAEEIAPSYGRRGVLDRLAARYGPAVAGTVSDKRRAEIAHLHDASGRPGGATMENYPRRKLVSTLAFTAVGVLLALTLSPLLLPAAVIIGWMWPDLLLYRAARERQARIDTDLPDFLDVLAVTVGAGVPFRPALARVSDALGGPVADELETSLHQIELGSTPRQSLQAMRDRNDSEALGQLVTGILQAEELGVPISDALVSQAADMRRAAYQRERRRAQRAAPRVSLVVTTLLVPASIVLIATALFIGTDVNFGRLF
jgi:tight adherence protein C